MDAFAKNSMFAPQAAQSKTKSTLLLSTRLKSKVRVFVFPANLSEEDSTIIAFAFCLTGSAVNKMSPEWKSYLVSYTCFLFPNLTRGLDKNAYEIEEMNVSDIASQMEKIKALVSAAQTQEEHTVIPSGFLSGFSLHDSLPSLGITTDEEWLGAECKMKHVYCHYATLLFLSAKQATDDRAKAQMAKKRPDALIRKYHLDSDTSILVGAFRLSEHAYTMLNVAWSELGAFKVQCISQFAKFSSDESNLAQDIIYTNMQLMKFSGMAHAQISYRFLKSYPWATEIPILRSSVVTFIDSLMQSNSIEPELQPYTKIMYGDKSALYPRKDMEPLVACAVAAETDIHETLQGFYTSQKFGGVIEAFLDERKDRETRRTHKSRGKAHHGAIPESTVTDDEAYESDEDAEDNE